MNTFKKTKKQVSIFITAGYPTIDSTMEQILMLQEKGIDFIELGIPFSDPMADGPAIQETSNLALQNGMNLDLLFTIIEQNKAKIHVPLVMMGYFNPIFLFGLERFLQKCSDLNIKHLIIPDISLEVYERNYQTQFEKYGVSLCFLVTPLTTDDRIIKMAEHSKNGFIYLVSQNAITGENKDSSSSLEQRYTEIKKLCKETPVMLGFGIQNKFDVEKAHQFTDGAIIGTAYLKALKLGQEEAFLNSFVQ